MNHYASVTSKFLHNDYASAEGAGAAGGLGFAFLSYLNATLTPGIDLILNAVELEKELEDTDITVTGEGRLDHQTAMGKAPVGVARLAKKYGSKVVAFAGSVTPEATACNAAGIDEFPDRPWNHNTRRSNGSQKCKIKYDSSCGTGIPSVIVLTLFTNFRECFCIIFTEILSFFMIFFFSYTDHQQHNNLRPDRSSSHL